MKDRLQLGDQLICPASGGIWTVRSVLPGRLRLVSADLRDNDSCGASLQLLAGHHPDVAHLRVNLRAASAVFERVSLKPWRRQTIQALLDQLGSPEQPLAFPAPQADRQRGPLLRLSLAGLLLLAQSSLTPVWMLPLGLLLLPPLLWPLLRGCLQEGSPATLPRESLDLAWYTSLLLRGELGTVATELALENGNEILQGPVNRAGSFSESLSEELHRWMEQARFPLEDGAAAPKRIEQMRRGDRLRLAAGDVVPLDGYVVSGEAVVSLQLLDGETASIPVRPFQALPVGVLLLQGQVVFRLRQELPEQPLYQQLLRISPQEHPPRGIERARQLHRQLMPLQLGGGLLALLLGLHQQAAALVQFDPINDWQLSASVAYRGARSLCTGWGVRLREGAVLDRLCQCRTLVMAEGAICHGVKRQLREVVSLHPAFSQETLMQIVAGFRWPHLADTRAPHPLLALLQERDLEPMRVEDLRPAGAFGLRGRIEGQRWWLGGGELLSSLGIARPAQMPRQRGHHWVFLLLDRQVVGGVLCRDQLDRDVSRSLRRLRRHGWRLHLVSTWHGDLLESVARELKLPPESVHSSLDLQQRLELIRDFDRSDGPVAYLGSALLDSGAFAEADIALGVSDGSLSLPAEMADIVLPARRLDRLVDCVTVAEQIGANNRQNFYLTLGPHAAALLFGLVLNLDPLLAVLLADMPLLLVELNNLKTYNTLRQDHQLGWKAQRKRTSRRRPTTRAPAGDRSRQLLGKA